MWNLMQLQQRLLRGRVLQRTWRRIRGALAGWQWLILQVLGGGNVQSHPRHSCEVCCFCGSNIVRRVIFRHWFLRPRNPLPLACQSNSLASGAGCGPSTRLQVCRRNRIKLGASYGRMSCLVDITLSVPSCVLMIDIVALVAATFVVVSVVAEVVSATLFVEHDEYACDQFLGNLF